VSEDKESGLDDIGEMNYQRGPELGKLARKARSRPRF
jgi:hypothetical protein